MGYSVVARAALASLRWAFSPLVVFVTLQVAWVAITVMWVIWFVEKNEQIRKLAEDFGAAYFDSQYALTTLVIGCVLLGMLAIGMIILFVSGLRQSRLVAQQRSFVSSVTHELRSPLSSLQLTLETLKTRKPDPGTRDRMVDMAIVDVQRLSRLVNQILVSAKLDRGLAGFEDQAEVINLAEIIGKAASRLHWLDQDLDARLRINCSDAIRINSAPSIVSLVISNLLENAIKYSPKATPIEVTVQDKKSGVEISVQDHGYGIAKSDLKRVFQMFYRGNVAKSKAIPGTGIGLFMVKSLTRLVGGNTEVRSNGLGMGTTFVVHFPSARG
jgi:signal transduction histidine kinase